MKNEDKIKNREIVEGYSALQQPVCASFELFCSFDCRISLGADVFHHHYYNIKPKSTKIS